jgi:site-specific DNA recombinase
MPSTNGHGAKRAILYARVSTDEQARSGYSLAQQLEALREYAAREGYEVLEEVSDPGQSGASLERPGMDRVRDLVAAGGVSVVPTQDRDRFVREPAYHYLLRREFEEYGCRIRALNDRGDDSPEGELTDGILDQLAKYERAKIAERTRRGKLRRAREGKIIPNGAPDYGFKYNDTRENYLIDEDAMHIVRRIFYMVGIEGHAIRAVKRKLQASGILTPKNKKYWSQTFIRNVILDDVYRPHSYEEIKELVTPEVAARLCPDECYGIYWFNRTKVTKKQVAENELSGRRYRRTSRTTYRHPSEWIAVPVPDSGVPREWVDTARVIIKDNRWSSNAGRRLWELSGGIIQCGSCGRAMVAHTTRGKRGTRYFYYACRMRYNVGRDACAAGKRISAAKLEAWVWEAVSSILKDPEQLRADLDGMIELERNSSRGDPEKEVKLWADKLAEVDRRRARYQEMAADDIISFDELRARLTELDDTRKTAERELEALRNRKEHLDELEQDRDALLDSLEEVAPDALDSLTPKERHRVYKMLRLKVEANPDDSLELIGAFGDGFSICENETAHRC